jgi:hypothetical protein
MKQILLLSLLLLTVHFAFSQSEIQTDERTNKKSIYVYWGWNWDSFSKSDIHFSGAGYDFTLKDAVADDKQADFSLETYFHPEKFTIPQYNFRVGYFFRENWDISFGVDHMKYVVRQNQEVGISGYINNVESIYDGQYNDDKITIKEGFLQFEHTDGLNYVNFEIRHTDKIIKRNKIAVSLKEGFGIGALIPRTNTTLLGNERYDKFHLAGYGLGAMVGINVTFYDKFFIQSEVKGGFIGLPDVRTTNSKIDKASQNFFYSQYNVGDYKTLIL